MLIAWANLNIISREKTWHCMIGQMVANYNHPLLQNHPVKSTTTLYSSNQSGAP